MELGSTGEEERRLSWGVDASRTRVGDGAGVAACNIRNWGCHCSQASWGMEIVGVDLGVDLWFWRHGRARRRGLVGEGDAR